MNISHVPTHRNLLAVLALSVALSASARPSKEEQMSRDASDLLAGVPAHLVDNTGAAVEDATVLKKPYVLFYWSAHWCGPCRNFTPKLVQFYNEEGGGEAFELVFVSADRSEEKMKHYMSATAMPWYAIEYGSKGKTDVGQFGVRGIPHLMLVDREGKQLDRGQGNVLKTLKQLLAKADATDE